MSVQLISDYYAAFNRADFESMLALLSDDVIHDINQGEREVGKPAFRAFLGRMEGAYREQLSELVIFCDASGTRCASEFRVDGTYLRSEPGYPEAHGQRYSLAAGAFFDVRDGRITRVTNYYNASAWIAQVAGAQHGQ